MSGNNSTPNNEWVSLNIGGTLFQTTKDTLSKYPQSFLARLVSDDIPSDKNGSGAYLIDRDPKHFSIILNFLRSPVLNLNGDKQVMKEILCEADFYNVAPLMYEIQKIMKSTVSRTELIVITAERVEMPTFGSCDVFGIILSETQDDYEVLNALRQKLAIEVAYNRQPCVRGRSLHHWTIIEATLRSYGFVEEFRCKWDGTDRQKDLGEIEFSGKYIWKFARCINE